MNTGLLQKVLRETWINTLLFALGLMILEAIFAYLFPTIFVDLSEQIMHMSFFQSISRALLGAEIEGKIAPYVMISFCWVHPIVLILVWSQCIMFCTRTPVGEIERGTIDVLLGLPVTRFQIYLSESVVWLVSGMFILFMGYAGSNAGMALVSLDKRVEMGSQNMVIVNLFCVNLAVVGIALFISTLSEKRGKAIGVIFYVVIVSFFINLIAQFWVPAKSIMFLCILNYYQPLATMRDATWPVMDMIILNIIGVVFWTAGAIIFSRRDIKTT